MKSRIVEIDWNKIEYTLFEVVYTIGNISRGQV